MERQILQIDLAAGEVLEDSGYPRTVPEVLDRRLRANLHRRSGERTFFLRGSFYGWTDAGDLMRWLEDFQPQEAAAWAARVDADFNLVVWDRAAETVWVVSDRTGAHRLYVHAGRGIVTVTDRLLDQARLQASPALDSFAVYTLLTLCYPLDPYSLLAGTSVVALGDLATCTGDGVEVVTYHRPVDTELEDPFPSTEACLTAVDAALRETFERRLSADTVPLVMLSGGIDSVVMLRYLTELAPGRVESMTLALEGTGNELEEARIAARYYGSRHREVIIPQSDFRALTQRSLIETDCSGYGGAQVVAVGDWFRGAQRWGAGLALDVFRGEDARLHTPALDLPALVGLQAHRHDVRRLPGGERLWNVRRLLRLWPLRYGRNYLRAGVEKTELAPTFTDYVLRCLARFHLPPGLFGDSLYRRLLREVPEFRRNDTLDCLYRKFVTLEYRAQHTEDMHDATCTVEVGAHHQALLPFFAPTLVEQWNRIPLSLGMRPILTTPSRTRSRSPVAGKYVLRRLMAGHAPDELLYRRKATAPGIGLQYDLAGDAVLFPALRSWGDDLLAMLEPGVREIVGAYRDRLLAGADPESDWLVAWAGFSLCHLAVLARVCAEPGADLEAELEAMAP